MKMMASSTAIPKSFEASASGGSANIVPVTANVPDDAKKAKRTARHEAEATGPKLEDAAVVISGGRGLQQPDNFKLLFTDDLGIKMLIGAVVLQGIGMFVISKIIKVEY